MVLEDEIWVFLAGVWFFSAIGFLALSVYLAIFKNPAMDRFIHNDERYVEAISAGGIPFGVLRAGEYGFYLILCRILNKPITRFFKSAKAEKANTSTFLYELNIVFALTFLVSSTAVYFSQPVSQTF